MIAAIVSWLLQDIGQVLAMGFLLVPEVFLLTVVYKIVSGPLDHRRISWWIWWGFLGGLLWDLRWAVAPGMSSLINVAAVMTVYWIWGRTPVGGRNALLFAMVAAGIHFLSGIVHYFAWAVPSQAAVRMFMAQQLMAIPVLIVLCAIYALKAREMHV